MALIPPIVLSQLEAGVKAYLEGRFAAGDITVPSPDGSETVPLVTPAIICGISVDKITPGAPVVFVTATDGPAVADGLYDQVRVDITAASPILVPGVTVEDHRSLAAAVFACFPARPRAGASPEDVAAWADLEEEFSDAVLAASGYEVHGWFAASGRSGRAQDRVEDSLILRPGLVHPAVSV